MKPHNFPVWPLILSLFAFFALTAALVASVPLGKSPDEAAHWQYVEHITQVGRLPVFKGAAPPAPGYEFHQPPLYYLLSAPAWKVGGAGVQNYACRAVSLLCGLLTIGVIWSAARLVFPRNFRVAAVAAGFAALFPMHQAVSAGSNNDSLAGLLAAMLFFLMAQIALSGAARRAVWQLGVVAGLSILTKNTLLVLVFVGFIALLSSTKKPNTKIELLPALGISLGITFALSGAWLWRNQSLYGDPLALGAFSAAATAGTPGFPEFSAVLGFFAYARGLGWMIFLTAWGFFGGPSGAVAASGPLSASGPRVTQLELAPLMLLCLLVPLGAVLGWRRIKNQEAQQEVHFETADFVASDAAISNRKTLFKVWRWGVALIIVAWAQFAYAHFSGGQARYLHGALLPFCVLGAAGWVGLWGQGRALKIASFLVGAALVLLTLLNVFNWKALD